MPRIPHPSVAAINLWANTLSASGRPHDPPVPVVEEEDDELLLKPEIILNTQSCPPWIGGRKK